MFYPNRFALIGALLGLAAGLNILPAAASQTCDQPLNPNTRLTRIVGGEGAEIRDYPWQVSLQVDGTHTCGASVIHPEWLLTAAHCIMGVDDGRRYDLRAEYSPQGSARAVVNQTDLRGAAGAPVGQAFVHPRWNGESGDGNDIALIKLQRPVTNDHVIGLSTPAFERKFLQPGMCAVVSGWGRMEEGGLVSPVLRAASLPLLSPQGCAQAYPGHATSDAICAGYPEGRVDSCQGDSGGPLVVDSPVFGRVLIGVVSYGEGCARAQRPGVYTSVARHQDWIKQTLQNH